MSLEQSGGIRVLRGRAMGGPSGGQAGYTLIELICVIVILGILSARAVPRFLDVGREARIASLKVMEGTLHNAAALLNLSCQMTAGCARTSGFFYLPYGGRTLLIQNAYPEAGDVVGGDQIDSIVSFSGFSVVLPNNLTTRFESSSAPTPSTCSVSYTQAASLGVEPVITSDSTGC